MRQFASRQFAIRQFRLRQFNVGTAVTRREGSPEPMGGGSGTKKRKKKAHVTQLVGKKLFAKGLSGTLAVNLEDDEGLAVLLLAMLDDD